jgi:hypothetical protein
LILVLFDQQLMIEEYQNQSRALFTLLIAFLSLK